MGKWWDDWRIWAWATYGKLPEQHRRAFLGDVLGVASSVVIVVASMPDLSSLWRNPLKLVKWGLANPDPLHEARRRAVEAKIKWGRHIISAPGASDE